MCRTSSLCSSPGKRFLAVFLVLAVASLLSGCSFWAVRGPGSQIGGRDCTTSLVAPVVDGVFAAGAVAGGVSAAGTPPCNSNVPFGCILNLPPAMHEAAGVLIGLAVLEAAAATYGGIQVAACRDAKARVAIPASSVKPAPGFDPRADGLVR